MISGVDNSSSKQSENHKNIFFSIRRKILMIVLVNQRKRFSIKILQNQEQNYLKVHITMKIITIYLLIKYKFAVKSFYIITPLFFCLRSIYIDFTKVERKEIGSNGVVHNFSIDYVRFIQKIVITSCLMSC